MWSPESIETEIEKTLMELDQDCVPKEQVCLLRNFELREKGYITTAEKNKIDRWLLSTDPENVVLGVALVESKITKHGLGNLETIR